MPSSHRAIGCCLVGQELARHPAGSASSTAPTTCSVKCASTERRCARASHGPFGQSLELEALLPPVAEAWRTSHRGVRPT
jgi:hypothetical protein